MLRSSKKPQQWGMTIHDPVILQKGVYGNPSEREWSHDRYQHWFEQGVAIISGSTFASNRSFRDDKTLDAAAVRKYYDQDGVLQSVIAMTLDGYGHGFGKIHDEISGDNKTLITKVDETITSSATFPLSLEQTLLAAGKATYTLRDQEVTQRGREIDLNGSALAATLIEYDQMGTLRSATVSNIGDTMVVILDSKTLKVKSILPARQYEFYDTRTTSFLFSPIPAHLIQHNPDALLYTQVEVVPGDIVIQMTDGVFNELACDTTITELKNNNPGANVKQKNTYEKTSNASRFREIRLQPEIFQTIFDAQFDNNELNPHDIAVTILEHANKSLNEKRGQEAKQHEEFSQWKQQNFKAIAQHADESAKEIPNAVRMTVKDLIAWKEKKGLTEADKGYSFKNLLEDLKKYWSYLQYRYPKMENVSYIDVTFRTLMEMINDCRLEGGDCATISVMRVPDPDVELFRALIESPSTRRESIKVRLVSRIGIRKKSNPDFNLITWQENIIALLKAERTIKPGSRGNGITETPIYNENQLTMVRSCIQEVDEHREDMGISRQAAPLEAREGSATPKKQGSLVHENVLSSSSQSSKEATKPVTRGRYLFRLDCVKNTLTRGLGKCVEFSDSDLFNLKISTLTDSDNGWVSVVSDKYHGKDPELVNEGKWVLTFAKGDSRIDEAWKKCIPLVTQSHEIHQIKASQLNDMFDTQVIVIYTKSTMADRARVYRLLENHGLLVSPGGAIKYKTENDTLFDINQLTTSDEKRTHDQVSYMPEHVILMDVMSKLNDHPYTTYGGGTKIGKKTYSKSAANFIDKIGKLLEKKIDYNDPAQIEAARSEYRILVNEISSELSAKTEETRRNCLGTFFLGRLGTRDKSTATLYKEIIAILPPVEISSARSTNCLSVAS